MALARVLWWWLRRVQEDALAEVLGAGAAVHLAFEDLDFVDGTFGFAVAVGQGQGGEDGGVVFADAAGKGAELVQAAGFGGCEPACEVCLAGAAGQHLGEGAGVGGGARRGGGGGGGGG